MKFLFIAAVILGFSANSFGQSEATASAFATLITPISIEKKVDLNFGTVASSNTDGIVQIATNGGITTDGGATLVAVGGAT